MANPSITRANWLRPENLRWALRNSRQVIPTATVARGTKPTIPLPADARQPFDEIAFVADAGHPTTLLRFLESSSVDAFLVLHHGQIVYERLLAGMTRDQPHQWASMTKSVTGLLAAVLAEQGVIDLERPTATYVPELADSPFGQATLQQNLDMEVSVDWPAEVSELHWMAAVGLLPNPGGVPTTIRDFLPAVGKRSITPHGSQFRYNNSSTEVVAWAMERAANATWPQLVADHIWSKLGAEADASVVVDSAGTPQASGGFSSTVGDLARFAEAIRTRGLVQGNRVLAASVVERATRPLPAGSPLNEAIDRFAKGNISQGRPGFSYRNGFFHVNDGEGSMQMSGRFGQRVHINPTAGITVVQFASYIGHGEETAGGFLAAMRAIADHLR